MHLPYSLKVPWQGQKHAELGDLTIGLTSQHEMEMGKYSGVLSVLRGNHRIILADIVFLPLDRFPPSAYDGSVAEVLDCGNVVMHAELASDYAFLSVVTGGSPYTEALERFGPAAALDLFNSIHEWGVLQARHSNPSWYRNELHAYIDDPLFEDQVLDHEYFEGYVNSAGHTFGSAIFESQLEAERLVSELGEIPVGNDDAAQQQDAAAFEAWCKKTIAFMLGDGFDPVQLHPNGQAFQRRDVVAINLFKSSFGTRIQNGFGVQHLVFEVKNKRKIEKQDIVQVVGYLKNSYGRLGFVIYRSDALVLDPVGAWRFRSIALIHRKHIVELTTGKITEMLRTFSMHWNPELFDHGLRELLNKYECDYINEPMPSAKSRG